MVTLEKRFSSFFRVCFLLVVFWANDQSNMNLYGLFRFSSEPVSFPDNV